MAANQSALHSTNAALPVADLKIYGRLVWRWAWLIVLCSLLAAGAAFAVSINMTPVYRASSQLMISIGNNTGVSSYADVYASERIAQTYAQLMTSSSTLERSLLRLGAEAPIEELSRQVTSASASPVRDTQLVNLTVEGINPEVIAAVANVIPQVFLEDLGQLQSARFSESKASLQEQLDVLGRQIESTQLEMGNLENARTSQEELDYGRLRNSLSQYQASYANLLQTYETLRLTEAQSLDNVVVMKPATTPEFPVRPRTRTNIMLAAIVGAMLALGVIFLIEFLDDRIRTPDDVKQITTLPVLGTISLTPKKDIGKDGQIELISVANPRHPTVEAFRRLRTNLQYYNVDEGLHSVLVTSAHPGAGKSTVAINLAIVLAQSGKKVVLVDTDLRRSRLHKVFGLPRQPGLAEMLATGVEAESLLSPVDRSVGSNMDNLRVLVAGGKVPNPAELLSSQRMHTLIDSLKQVADVIILDAPPLMAVADAQVLGQLVDGVLLMANIQKTSRGDLQRSIEMLEQVQAPVLGVVLNRFSKSGHGYYYTTYDYYYADSDEDEGDTGDHHDGAPAFPQRVAAKGTPSA